MTLVQLLCYCQTLKGIHLALCVDMQPLLQACRALRFVNGNTQKAADLIMVRRQQDQVWVVTRAARNCSCLTVPHKAPVSCGSSCCLIYGPDSTCAQGEHPLT